MKKGAVSLIILTCLLSSVPALAQEVTETYKQGTYIEDATLITAGPHAGKFAVIDGWSVYLYDHDAGTYEKLFSYAGLGLLYPSRGLCAVSGGEFAGHFLLNDYGHKNTLFIINDAGELIDEVSAVNFEWTAHCEGLTEITGGPDRGKFAMLGYQTVTYPISHHIFIFRMERDGGDIKAVLERDLVYVQNEYRVATGLCYIDETHPDSTLWNHFVTSSLGQQKLYVVDMTGTVKKSILNKSNIQVEGLVYINSGPRAGNFLFADRWSEENCIRDLDGITSLPTNLHIGLNLFQPKSIAWLEDSGQFLEASLFFSLQTFNGFYTLTRLEGQNWRKDGQHSYSQIYNTLEVTAMTPRGVHFLLGFDRVNNQNVYRAQTLDVNFNLVTSYTIPQQYAPAAPRYISYIPATATADDAVMIAATGTTDQKILYFDAAFSTAPRVVDVTSKIWRIWGICYDAANERYYVSEGLKLKIFDSSWNEIAAFDLSPFIPRIAANLTKITSGELKSNLAICNFDDNEIVFLMAEYAIAAKQIEALLQLVEASEINSGIMNSLVKKLEGALDAVNEKRIAPAVNKVESFQNEVRAQSGKKIPADTADDWLHQAASIIRGLNNI